MTELQIEKSFTVQKLEGSEILTEEGLRERVRSGALLFEIMDHTGDVKKIWNPEIPAEVEDARRSYDDLRKKGYRAFRVNEKGDQGEMMSSFEPKAGRVVMIPQMAGG